MFYTILQPGFFYSSKAVENKINWCSFNKNNVMKDNDNFHKF